MKWMTRLGLCAGSLMLVGVVAVSAAPKKWGFSPYNKLTTVTEEQKEKITEIHKKALAEKKAIDEKEEADVMALLTDEQKAELDKIEADRKAALKERNAERKKKGESEKPDDKSTDDKDGDK